MAVTDKKIRIHYIYKGGVLCHEFAPKHWGKWSAVADPEQVTCKRCLIKHHRLQLRRELGNENQV